MCRKCGNDFVWHTGCVTDGIPDGCPSCGIEWQGQSYESWKRVKQFLRLTQPVSSPQDEPQFTIRLELDIGGLRSPESDR